MLFCLLLMGISTMAIGFLPDYDTIGVAAPALLVFLRLCQGLSAAGEQSGATSMTIEHSPANRRGFFASWTLNGTQTGLILANLVFIPFSMMDEAALYTWGWRIPFMLSGVLVLIAFVVRRTLEETPSFTDRKAENEVSKAPIPELFRTQSRQILTVITCASIAVVSSITATFGVAYASKPEYGHSNIVSSSTMLWIVIGANLGALLVQPLVAILSDSIGRKPILITAAIGCASTSFFYLWSLTSGNGWLIFLGQFIITSIFYSCYNGIWPAFYPEQFASRVRYSGVALSTQLGVVVTGFAPAIAAALLQPGEFGWLPVAFFVCGTAVVTLVGVLFSRETYNVPMDELGPRGVRTRNEVEPTV